MGKLLIGAVAGIVTLFLVTLIIDKSKGHWEYPTGTVYGRDYTPMKTQTDIFIVDGKATVSTHTSSERWTLLIYANGSVRSVSTTPTEYGLLHDGDNVSMRHWLGCVTEDGGWYIEGKLPATASVEKQ